MTMLK